jgi:hypothetical protein
MKVLVIGWYLVMSAQNFPTVTNEGKIGRRDFKAIVDSFDTASKCTAERDKFNSRWQLDALKGMNEANGDLQKLKERGYAQAVCIATDDPRLPTMGIE